jgi:hypothetical protein
MFTGSMMTLGSALRSRIPQHMVPVNAWASQHSGTAESRELDPDTGALCDLRNRSRRLDWTCPAHWNLVSCEGESDRATNITVPLYRSDTVQRVLFPHF